MKTISDMTEPVPSKTFVLLDERDDSINDGYVFWLQERATGKK